jgi:hypothetical protein
VVVTGALEPSYDIGGDTVDHAVDGAPVDLVVLDAVGQGLPAALPGDAVRGPPAPTGPTQHGGRRVRGRGHGRG